LTANYIRGTELLLQCKAERSTRSKVA